MLEQEGLVVSRTAAGTRVAKSAAVLPRSVVKHVRELTKAATTSDAKARRRDERAPRAVACERWCRSWIRLTRPRLPCLRQFKSLSRSTV